MKTHRANLVAAACLALFSCAAPSPSVPLPSTLPSVVSQSGFDVTVLQLQQAVQKRKLKLFLVVDHGAGARSVGEDLGESKLLIFGNPKVGTTFMQADSRFGLELPLKALVYEQGGQVHITATDIDTLAARYGITGLEPVLEKVRMAIAGIVAEGAQ